MVDQVTFPPSIGGSGNTYTNDANPETGMYGGAHRKNFFPIQADMVAAAGYVSQYAQAIDGAKANADRAEDAKGYVEAVADQYQINILEQFRRSATLDFDFGRGIYNADSKSLTQTTDFSAVGTVTRETLKLEEGASGALEEFGVDEISRRWLDSQPLGASVGEARKNEVLHSGDFNESIWIGGTLWFDSGIPSPIKSVNFQRMAVTVAGQSNAISQDFPGGLGRVTLSVFVGNATTTGNILFALSDNAGGSSRATVNFDSEEITGVNGFGNPIVYVDPCVNGKRIGISFDSYDVDTQRAVYSFKNSQQSVSFISDLVVGDVIDVEGSQVEFGECFSPYIPTTTASIFRASENIFFDVEASPSPDFSQGIKESG